MSKDYTHLYRDQLQINADWDIEWHVFISAFNGSERVRRVFEKVRAMNKYWIVHEEYAFKNSELPSTNSFACKALVEDEMLTFWESHLAGLVSDADCTRVCLDATGFMRPQLMFLVNLLYSKGINKFEVLYSEPEYYLNQDNTKFAGSYIDDVRQVAGFEGITDDLGSRDVLIIGAGYETHLISEVAEDKEESRKIVLLGLPSLRPDMYQQNAWRAWQASDAISLDESERYFAPASDIFATATVISELISMQKQREGLRHIYLAPLSTKAQAIGFALCFLTEYQRSNISIIYPFTREYEQETSVGLARIWRHTLEFS